MKNNDLKNKTTEQLQSSLNTNKAIAITLIIVTALLMTLTIYGFLAKENKMPFIALFAVVLSSCSFLPLPFSSMKEIRTELSFRNNN